MEEHKQHHRPFRAEVASIFLIVFGILESLSLMGLNYTVTSNLSSPLTMIIKLASSLEISPMFPPSNLIMIWLICVALSLIAGLYPAWRASRLDPVVALGHE